MDNEKIGNLIRKKRLEKGLKQYDLSVMLDVTDKTVSKWECGRGCPDISIIEKLCDILDISIVELLNGEEKGKIDKSSNEYVENAVRILNEERRNFLINILKGVLLVFIFTLFIIQFFHIAYLRKTITYDFTETHKYFMEKLDKIESDLEEIKNRDLLDKEDIASLNEIIDFYKNSTIVNMDNKVSLRKKDLYEIDKEQLEMPLLSFVFKDFNLHDNNVVSFLNVYKYNYEQDTNNQTLLYDISEMTAKYESMIYSRYEKSSIDSRIFKEKYEIESINYLLRLVLEGEEYE